jgi:RNA polymerase sigma-70 factor (ECF subfamily)
VDANADAVLAGLLRSALGGDERAYAEFLASVAMIIRGFVRRRAGQGTVEVEDVVQETLLAIHLKRHTWREDAAVLPWLFAIARYKLIDAFRKRGKHIEVDIDDVSHGIAAPQEDDRPSAREIDRALAILPEGQRSVVSAVSVDGHSIGEAASRLGMNETAVRVALHRGLKAIAKRFGQN